MRRTISAIVAISLAVATPLAAHAASKQENIGIGAGAVVGAAAGGPIGLFVGAVVGASIGDRMHQKSVEIESLSESLERAGIEMDLLFRTDEAVLADSTGIRLNQLATTISDMPGIHVRLDGFADERGDDVYNQELSQRRVDFVREQLVTAGIDASRITVNAYGESKAQDETVDSYALERRVSMTLFHDQAPSVAANPE